jgi:(p)ppGpp synthase/HD superfamily hydrolase
VILDATIAAVAPPSRLRDGNGVCGDVVVAKRSFAMPQPIRLISEAAELAASRHNGMARKGRGKEPYINHLAEVANLLAAATDGTDAELVAAGWLHDTVEDTDTTREELVQKFSERVAALVVEVTDDMSLPKQQRRQKQIEDAPHKSPGAKMIKIADKISNIRARTRPNLSEDERDDLAAYVIWAEKVVAGCQGVNTMLDAEFDDAVKAAKSAF